jgi:hypothetical protein
MNVYKLTDRYWKCDEDNAYQKFITAIATKDTTTIHELRRSILLSPTEIDGLSKINKVL